MQAFNASNKPNTCRWCGKGLSHVGSTRWDYTDQAPKRCKKRDCRGTEFDRVDEVVFGQPRVYWRCCTCDYLNDSRRSVKTRERFYDKPGYRGSGHFCSATCGFAFACALANRGHILTRK